MKDLRDFTKVRVLVAGDVMLDRYWWGSVSRISPEAPVPVVEVINTSDVPGGAANVARNIAGLGASAVLFGAIGADKDGDNLVHVLHELALDDQHIVRSSEVFTTVKTRIVAHGQHVVRVDRESANHLPSDAERAALDMIDQLVASVDIVVISDYAKGFLTTRILEKLIASARAQGKQTIADPKGRNFGKYTGVDILTPNRKEAAEATGTDPGDSDTLKSSVAEMMLSLDIPNALVTLSEDGMMVFQKGSSPERLKAEALETYDVTGAGDTVIACLAVATAAGYGFLDAAKIANKAASIVVGQVGTSSITLEGLAARIKNSDTANA